LTYKIIEAGPSSALFLRNGKKAKVNATRLV